MISRLIQDRIIEYRNENKMSTRTSSFFSNRNLFRQKARQQSRLTCLLGFHSNSYRLTRAIQRYNTCKIPFHILFIVNRFFRFIHFFYRQPFNHLHKTTIFYLDMISKNFKWKNLSA